VNTDPTTKRERWLAASCYLGGGVLFTMLAPDRSAFVAKHIKQGLALFFAEVVGTLLILIVDNTLGRVPVLGFLLVMSLELVGSLGALAISALGFSKAIFGESWRIPYLDDLADRFPID